VNRYYAGIGSRETPNTILREMKRLSSILEDKGWTLRTGGAIGADTAFASGVKRNAEIWIPWEGFGNPDSNHTVNVVTCEDTKSFESVEKYHPKSKDLSGAVKKLMARNYRVVVDSEFIVCWTRNGVINGGTGQSLRIAIDKGIPIFNMFFLSTDEILKSVDLLFES
jgi:hypothetical protein